MRQAADTGPQLRAEQQARIEALYDGIVRYAHGPLPRRLGAPGPPVAIRRDALGTRSVVHFVEFDGFPRVVLRALPRWLPAVRLARNFRSFARMGLPVPELLYSDLSPLTRWRWGFYALAEQWIEGQHPTEMADREPGVRAMGRALARFHSVERRRWGWPAFPRPGSYRAYFLERISRRIRHLDPALRPSGQAALEAWFREQGEEPALDPPFSLTHSRVNKVNFVVRPDGEVVVLDLIECRYGTFCPDLISALDRICERDEMLTASFLDEYFGRRPPRCREAFVRSRAFFEARHELAQSAINARRTARSATADEADASRDLLRGHVARLAALTGIELTLAEP